eukprot:XP_011665356.1 PREDICTED: ras-related protein Rab-26-like [Strongylocentrotus purpuratus]
MRVRAEVDEMSHTSRFRSIPHAYFRKADGVLLLYDISCEKSFLNVQSWIASIREHDDNAVIMLTGNKEDLASPYREVPREAALKVARENNALFIETSAKNGTNVFEAFGRLARELQKKEDDTSSRVYEMDVEEQNIAFAPKKKRRCCNF